MTGTGRYNPVTHLYEFSGHSEVGTLPNVNSAGRRNDITINEVSQAVYSLDGGTTWMVAELEPPPAPLAWVRWRATLPAPARGAVVLRVRATDGTGALQPVGPEPP